MRIYISGPITGVENYLEHFKAAEDYWSSQGLEKAKKMLFEKIQQIYAKWDGDLVKVQDT